jgi:ATP-dependent DNA helicase DinG
MAGCRGDCFLRSVQTTSLPSEQVPTSNGQSDAPTPERQSFLATLLAPGGALAVAMEQVMGVGYEVRPQQAQMCEAVALAMQTRSHVLAEAGTGTGKSLAYLLPAALRCVLYGERVVVSTHTISLQEQILNKDLPVVERVIKLLAERGQLPEPATEDGKVRELKGVLVKGRGNYVSVRRLKLASERQDRLFADPASKRSLHVIEDWAGSTRDGTLSTLPPIERWGVWDKVQSDSGNCMGKKCPNHGQCFYQAARAQLEDANLMVCNHALFFSDLALRVQDAGFLPAYQHAIFDEGHNVEEVASEHFGASLSEGRVQHLLSTLYQARTGKGYLGQLALASEDMQPVEKAIGLVIRAGDEARVFFEQLQQIAASGSRESAGGASGGGSGASKPWTQRGATSEGRIEPRITRVREADVVPNSMAGAMRELSMRLRGLRDVAKLEADKYELNAYAQRAEMIAQDATTLVKQASPACAYWIEVTGGDEGSGSSQRVTFACAPIEVAPLLKSKLFAPEHQLSVVVTSATLATGGVVRGGWEAPAPAPGAGASQPPRKSESTPAFTHTIRQLGCDGAATLQVASPFDYREQVEVFVERVELKPRAPEPPSGDFVMPGDEVPVFVRDRSGGFGSRAARPGSAYAEGLATSILQHVRETDGGAFVLFTSFATLHQVARAIEQPLARLALPLLVQGKDGSRTAILQKFREDERSVLLGAASFWQGVDVRGRGLRNVIITKLPFDPPDRPLVQARGELIQSRGGNPFMEDALPRAVLRFKQGFGRLIRSKTDKGRVVILDDRVLTTRYGRAFLEALPEGVRIHSGRE